MNWSANQQHTVTSLQLSSTMPATQREASNLNVEVMACMDVQQAAHAVLHIGYYLPAQYRFLKQCKIYAKDPYLC